MTKSKKFYIALLVGLAIGGVVFKDPLYMKGVGFYNKVVPAPHKLEVIHMETNSLTEEKLRLQVLLEKEDYNLYQLTMISAGGMMGNSRMTTADADTVYQRFNGYNTDGTLYIDETDYVLDVILCQWFAGNVEETVSLLGKLPLNDLSEEERNKASIIKSALALAYYDRQKLEESLQGMTLEKYNVVKRALEDFIAKYFDGNLDRDPIDVTSEQMNSDRYIGYYRDLYDSLLNKDYYYGDASKGALRDQSIVGHVSLNGQPVQGVFVYLDYDRGMSSREGFYNELRVTDENGYYKFEKAHEKLLSVCIMVPWQRFNQSQFPGRWEFSILESGQDVVWDFEFNDGARFSYLEIEGEKLHYEIVDPLASPERSYNLGIEFADPKWLNNYTYIGYSIGYDALKGSIPLKDIHNQTDAPISYMSSNSPLDLERFIEPLYLTGDYAIQVHPSTDARDSYIHNGMMTDKLKSIVHYKGADGYNEGDKLLDNGLYEEAIAWYVDHPSQHNLKVLIELTARGTQVVEEDEFISELTGGDPEKAIGYLKEQMDLYGQTSKRINYVARLYKKLENYEEEEKWILKNIDDKESPYDYFALGYCYINQGRYQEGLEMLISKGDMDIDGERFYNYFILGDSLDPLPDALKEGLKTLDGKEDFKPFFDLIQSGDNKEAYKWLIAQPDSDLKNFYILNYLDRFDYEGYNFEAYKKDLGLDDKLSFIDYYREVYSKTNSNEIKSLYELLKKRYNWL